MTGHISQAGRIDERIAVPLPERCPRCGGGVEPIAQQKRRIAAHEPVEAMEEEAAQIGGRRKLAHVLDVALPAQERRHSEGTVFGAVIEAVAPVPETIIEFPSRVRRRLGSRLARNWSRTVRKQRSILPLDRLANDTRRRSSISA